MAGKNAKLGTTQKPENRTVRKPAINQYEALADNFWEMAESGNFK
jgi:hypothetical protein